MSHPLDLENLAHQCKGLADPTRLRILALLEGGELCVCDLMAALDMGQSKVSRHLSVLKHAGWLSTRRVGKWMHYMLSESLNELQASALAGLLQHVNDVEEMARDKERLCHHLASKPAEICA